MNEKGFTYLEVMIAFAIFGLMLVVTLHINNSVYMIMKHNLDINKTRHLAEFELENYKSALVDLGSFIDDTGFVLVSESPAAVGTGIDRKLQNGNVDEKYTVVIDEISEGENLATIKVVVQNNFNGADTVVLREKAIKE